MARGSWLVACGSWLVARRSDSSRATPPFDLFATVFAPTSRVGMYVGARPNFRTCRVLRSIASTRASIAPPACEYSNAYLLTGPPTTHRPPDVHNVRSLNPPGTPNCGFATHAPRGRTTHAETIMPEGELRNAFQRASVALPTTARLANADDAWLGTVNAANAVRLEDTRRSAVVEDAPADKWQPGDGYRPPAKNLQAALDSAVGSAGEQGGAQGVMVSPASCGYRAGKAKSRGSIVAANPAAVSKYTPPSLRTSLHESS